MKKNMGNTDRGIRLVLAVIIAISYGIGMISGTTATILLLLAIVFTLTSFISFCPLYLPFGISTRKNK